MEERETEVGTDRKEHSADFNPLAAYIWIYPKADQVVICGRDRLTSYRMGSGLWNETLLST